MIEKKWHESKLCVRFEVPQLLLMIHSDYHKYTYLLEYLVLLLGKVVVSLQHSRVPFSIHNCCVFLINDRVCKCKSKKILTADSVLLFKTLTNA